MTLICNLGYYQVIGIGLKYTFVPGYELNHIQAGSAFNLNWAKD